MLLFIPLITLRSQQFHPWYLLWSLAWVPLIIDTPLPTTSSKISPILSVLNNFWPTVVLTFSFTSLMRYIPYLWSGEYTTVVLQQQKIITWSALLIAPVLLFMVVKKR
jgi:hypothetical protein